MRATRPSNSICSVATNALKSRSRTCGRRSTAAPRLAIQACDAAPRTVSLRRAKSSATPSGMPIRAASVPTTSGCRPLASTPTTPGIAAARLAASSAQAIGAVPERLSTPARAETCTSGGGASRVRARRTSISASFETKPFTS